MDRAALHALVSAAPLVADGGMGTSLIATGVPVGSCFELLNVDDPERVERIHRSFVEAGSDLLLLPVQDVFGWSDRINDPATVGEMNWTFRLPWPSDKLDEIHQARERQAALRGWAARYGRL